MGTPTIEGFWNLLKFTQPVKDAASPSLTNVYSCLLGTKHQTRHWEDWDSGDMTLLPKTHVQFGDEMEKDKYRISQTMTRSVIRA